MDSFMDRLNKRMKLQQGTAVMDETPVMEVPQEESAESRSSIEEKVLEAYLEQLVASKVKEASTERTRKPQPQTHAAPQPAPQPVPQPAPQAAPQPYMAPVYGTAPQPAPGPMPGMYAAPQGMYGAYPQGMPQMMGQPMPPMYPGYVPGQVPQPSVAPGTSNYASEERTEKTLDALEAEVERLSVQLKEYASYLRTVKEAELRSQSLAEKSMAAADKNMNVTEKLTDVLRGLDQIRVELGEKISKMDVNAQKPADLGPAVVDIINSVKDTQNSIELSEKRTVEAISQVQNMVTDMVPMKTEIENIGSSLAEMKDGILEGTHKENVKTYRNVQAVVVDSDAKVVAELTELHNRDSRKATTAVVFSVLAFLAAAGVLALNIYNMFF